MRDPGRIRRITEKLTRLWEANPDWRLGQLVSNVQPSTNARYIFYMEDDVLEQALDARIGKERR